MKLRRQSDGAEISLDGNWAEVKEEQWEHVTERIIELSSCVGIWKDGPQHCLDVASGYRLRKVNLLVSLDGHALTALQEQWAFIVERKVS